MADSENLRLRELNERVGRILEHVRELMAERDSLRTTLARTEEALEQAQASLAETCGLKERLAHYAQERDEIRATVDGMLSQIIALEEELTPKDDLGES